MPHNERHIVPDTNILYAYRPETLRVFEETYGARLRPSILSALEIVANVKESNFEKRQNAARTMLTFADNIIEDSHAIQAQLLGYKPPSGYGQDFKVLLERFAGMNRYTESELRRARLNLGVAREAKKTVSLQFVNKVHGLFGFFREEVRKAALGGLSIEGKKNKFLMAASRDIETVRRIVSFHRPVIEDSLLTTIREFSSMSGFAGTASEGPGVLSRYVDCYSEFMSVKLTEGAPEMNDYIDLQFFAYMDAGYRFMTRELDLQQIALSANHASRIIPLGRYLKESVSC